MATIRLPKFSAHAKAQVLRLVRLAVFVLVGGGGADLLIQGAAQRLGLSAAVVAVLETAFRQFAKVTPAVPDVAATKSLP